MTSLRAAAQVLLGAFFCLAGTAHLTFARTDFRAQVPGWVPLDTDLVIVVSGVIEIGLGLLLVVLWRQPARARIGVVVAIFLVLVFPGNVHQYLAHRDAFGLDTDGARLTRLFVQPLLIGWALWATSFTFSTILSSDSSPEEAP